MLHFTQLYREVIRVGCKSAGRRALCVRLAALSPLRTARWRLQLASSGGLHLLAANLFIPLLLLLLLGLLLLPPWRRRSRLPLLQLPLLLLLAMLQQLQLLGRQLVWLLAAGGWAPRRQNRLLRLLLLLGRWVSGSLLFCLLR